MDCGCIYVGDYDPAPFYSIKTHKATKIHICGECGREIRKGEEYENAFAVWDSGPRTCKTCADCISVREAFFCEGYVHGMIWEHVREHIQGMDGRVSSSCLDSLTPIAKTSVVEIIDEVLEEE